MAVGSGLAAEVGPHFAYTGDEGPAFWGELDPDWAACIEDTRQSPINLRNVTPDPSLEPLVLDLEPSDLDLVNNGHTIQFVYEPGSMVTFEGVTYELLQFHFHTLAEHTLDRVRHPMEMHAVFLHAGSGDLLVIGQLFRLGAASRFLDGFDDVLPERSGDHVSSGLQVSLAAGLRDPGAYITYEGSLTTPPCSPIVTWVVLKKPATMSAAQLNRHFWRIMGNNFRPTQPRNDRVLRSTVD
jgi:carbonic anhydrase